jgi:hypothetical protein
MKTPALLIKLAIVFSCLTFSYGRENPEADASYEKALKQLQSGDPSIDFKTFRITCAQSKYTCEADSDDTKKLARLLNEKKFDEALTEVNRLLKTIFVDIDLHYIAFIANTETGHKDKAEFHKTVARGLLDSIQENKKGHSEADAFEVISVHEEYVFLRFSNMRVTGQSLANKNGHSYDVMVCTDMSDPEKREVTAYFNVDIPLRQLANAIKD